MPSHKSALNSIDFWSQNGIYSNYSNLYWGHWQRVEVIVDIMLAGACQIGSLDFSEFADGNKTEHIY
jgi:hypothetical protein